MDDLLLSLKLLNEIGASILSNHSTEEMIDTVYQHVNQLMDAYSFAIGIYNPVSERFEFIGARENDIKLPAFSAYVHNMERFSGWMFAHQKEILINDLDAEYHLYFKNKVTPLQGMEPLSLMYVPLFYNKDLIGMLSVRTMAKNAYTLQNLEMLKTLAVFIGKAIGNNRASAKPQVILPQIPTEYLTNPLSSREADVLCLLAQGMANKAIADNLFISASTVKTHTLNIYQKLQAANRTEAIIKAKAYGIIA